MELAHDFVVPAPIEAAWETFMDLERVGGCFPGAVVTSVTEDGFTGTVKVKLGPIALVYTGAGKFLERDDSAHRAVIEAKGKDKRGNGTAGATVTVQLAPSEGGTRVDVTTDLAITGKPAQFGRGVMQDVSDKLLQQFVACIESQFASEEQAAAESPAPAAAVVDSMPASSEKASAEPSPKPSPSSEPSPERDEAPAPHTAQVAPSGETAPSAAEAAEAVAAPAGAHPPRLAAAAPVTPRSTHAADDSIDLGATVLPVLIKSYAPYFAAGLLGLAVGIALGRKSG